MENKELNKKEQLSYNIEKLRTKIIEVLGSEVIKDAEEKEKFVRNEYDKKINEYRKK